MKTLTGIGFLSLLAACSSAGPAQSHPHQLGLAEIQAHWLAAMGGKDALGAVHGVHQVADIQVGGLTGSGETWNDDAGHLRQSTRIGDAIHQEDILSGGQAWVVDPSGAVHEQTGADLQSLVSQEYEASYSQLLPGRLPGHMELTGFDAARNAYVLQVLADGGKPVTLYLDAISFLPQSESIRQDDQTQTTIFSGWHAVSGVQVASVQRQSTGDPKYDFVLTLRSLEFNPALDAALFAKPAEASAAVRYDGPDHAVRVPFEFYHHHIWLPVSVNGHEPVVFAMDSGAEASALDKGFADKLGLQHSGQLEIGGTGGSDSMSVAKDLDFGLGGAHVPAKLAAVLPLGNLAAVTGKSFNGLIGFDVLSRFVVQIDYAAHVVTFHDPATFRYSGKGAVLPFTYHGNLVQIPVSVTLPGRKPVATLADIDTGSGSTDLSAPFVDANDAMKAVSKTVERFGFGVGGGNTEPDARISAIQVGPYVLREPVVGLSRSKQGSFSSADLGVNLGADILARFTLILDYPHQQVILEPNAHLDDPFRTDASGLTLIAQGEELQQLIAYDVRKGSPADQAGIRKGDLIATIDGKPAAGFMLGEVSELLTHDGETHRFGLVRDGKKLEVTLALQKQI